MKEYKPVVKDNSSTNNTFSKPQIGMNKEEVIRIWGTPKDKNIHDHSWGTTEQWVYSNGRYVYFDDGKVSSVTTRE